MWSAAGWAAWWNDPSWWSAQPNVASHASWWGTYSWTDAGASSTTTGSQPTAQQLPPGTGAAPSNSTAAGSQPTLPQPGPEGGGQTQEAGSTAAGSQPTAQQQAQAMFWQYQEDDGTWNMFDDSQHERLNHALEEMHSGGNGLLDVTHQQKCGRPDVYDVDVGRREQTNRKTGMTRVMRRVGVEVLADASGSQPTHDKTDLCWQVLLQWGWKNMSTEVSATLMRAWSGGATACCVEHVWLHPKTKRRNTTTYHMDFTRFRQRSRDGRWTQRDIRLVAFSEEF